MKGNGIAATLKWIGYCLIAAGVISAFVIGSKTENGLLAVVGMLSGFVVGMGFVGFGEAIRLLNIIAMTETNDLDDVEIEDNNAEEE